MVETVFEINIKKIDEGFTIYTSAPSWAYRESEAYHEFYRKTLEEAIICAKETLDTEFEIGKKSRYFTLRFLEDD